MYFKPRPPAISKMFLILFDCMLKYSNKRRFLAACWIVMYQMCMYMCVKYVILWRIVT